MMMHELTYTSIYKMRAVPKKMYMTHYKHIYIYTYIHTYIHINLFILNNEYYDNLFESSPS